MSEATLRKMIAETPLDRLPALEELIAERRELAAVKEAAKRARADLANKKTHSLASIKAEFNLK